MTLLEYSKNQFYHDLKLIISNSPKEIQPNKIILELNAHFNEKTTFIGGRQWCYFKHDINYVSTINRAYFCICFFSMVSADQNTYAHFPNLTEQWTKQFQYPKFGWCGFGAHFEKVKYLLQIPEQNGVDFNDIADSEIQEYFCFHYQSGSNILGNNIEHFFRIMLEDSDFDFESEIFSRFRKIMIDSIEERRCI